MNKKILQPQIIVDQGRHSTSLCNAKPCSNKLWPVQNNFSEKKNRKNIKQHLWKGLPPVLHEDCDGVTLTKPNWQEIMRNLVPQNIAWYCLVFIPSCVCLKLRNALQRFYIVSIIFNIFCLLRPPGCCNPQLAGKSTPLLGSGTSPSEGISQLSWNWKCFVNE